MDTRLERRARIQVKALTRGHHTLTQMSPSINLAVESKTSFWGLYDGIEIDDFIPSVTKLSNIDESVLVYLNLNDKNMPRDQPGLPLFFY